MPFAVDTMRKPTPFERFGIWWLKSLRPRFVGGALPSASGILAVWHEDFLLCLPAFRRLRLRALVSHSRDGERAALACRAFGYGVIRGSSSRGGAQALRALVRELKRDGGWAALVVDGPRGPRRKCKPGILWLSEQTGIPVTAASARAFPARRLNNWDQSVLPAPFASVRLRLTDPLRPDGVAALDRLMADNAIGDF